MMMRLQLVPYTHVDQVWPTVAPLLARACGEKAADGEYTIDQIRMAIVQKDRHLVIGLEGEEIVGAATIEFQQFPQKRVALISALGGKGVVSAEALTTVKDWCRGMGASELRVFAKDAQARLFSKVGLTKVYEMMGVPL